VGKAAAEHAAAEGIPFASNVTDDMFQVEQLSNNTVRITKYTGSEKNVIIPATLYGLPVAEIGGFYGNKTIQRVLIPDTVTSIVNRAFGSCTSLNLVAIGNGVTSIPSEAFNGCAALTKVTIGSKVTSIGASAFSGCNRLTKITIPDSVITIEQGAFSDCGLTTVTLGNGLKTIGASAFEGGTASKTEGEGKFRKTTYTYTGQLTSITLPDGITSIGANAFAKNKLTSVILPAGVTSIGEKAFAANKITSVTIPAGITSVGKDIFSGSAITNITLPANVNDSHLSNYNFEQTFITFYTGQNRAAGTYTKNGPIWARSTAGGID
jgi:YD repeat-containing protein